MATTKINLKGITELDFPTGISSVSVSKGVTTVNLAGSGLTLQVNGTPNGSQSLLNLAAGSGMTITDGGSGTVTFASSGGSSGLDSGSSKYRHMMISTIGGSIVGVSAPWSTMGSVFNSIIFTAGQAPGTDYDNGNLGQLCGGMMNDASATAHWLNFGTSIQFRCVCMPVTNTTNVRMWVGVTNGAPNAILTNMGGSDAPAATNYAAFRFSSAASDAHYVCVTSDGSGQVVTDSGVSVALNVSHIFGIVFDDVTPNIKFYIDGVLVATNTTHLPTSGACTAFAGLGYVTGSITTHFYINQMDVWTTK